MEYPRLPMSMPSTPPSAPDSAANGAVLVHDAFYRFVRIADPQALAQRLREWTAALHGSILVAPEGINGMLAGPAVELAHFRQRLTTDPVLDGLFTGMEFRRSTCVTRPFNRMKVHAKPEIVPLGIAGIDAVCRAGINLDPPAWRALLRDPELLLIDNRNSFEYRLGRFRNAINPDVHHFRDFPRYVEQHIDAWKRQGQKVAMYCTGGIRCEKTSAWMLDLGLPVYQLAGGILRYFEQMPDADADWDGECFVFDNRIALDTRLRETATTAEQVYDGEADGAWRLQRARLLEAG